MRPALDGLPQSYRYLLRRSGEAVVDSTAWQCSACAAATIPLNDTMLVTDRWTAKCWLTKRVADDRVELRRAWTTFDGAIHSSDNAPTTGVIMPHHHPFDGPVSLFVCDLQPEPVPFGRGADSPDLVSEPATIQRVEQFLKEVRAS